MLSKSQIPTLRQKKLITDAYQQSESGGICVWNEDEAGPYQAIPQPGRSWRSEGDPVHQPHEYIRGGTAKVMTLFHPATGQVRIKGVVSCTNAVLHPWIKQELTQILEQLPPRSDIKTEQENRDEWCRWQVGLTRTILLPKNLPPLRLILILDNLAGHKSEDFVDWLICNGVMPLYTPIGGSWLNMAESIQGIIGRRALSGQHPENPQQIIEWMEATAKGWNKNPTAFHWAGKRAARRYRAKMKRHFQTRSSCYTRRSIDKRKIDYQQTK